MVNFKEIYHFSRFQRGSNFFQGGGGSNCLFPIETHITCDFPGGGGGGSDPLSPPPLDPYLACTHFGAYVWLILETRHQINFLSSMDNCMGVEN